MWRRSEPAVETPSVHLDDEQLRDLQTINLLRSDMMHLDAMRLQQVINEKRFKMEKQIILNTIEELEKKYGISS